MSAGWDIMGQVHLCQIAGKTRNIAGDFVDGEIHQQH